MAGKILRGVCAWTIAAAVTSTGALAQETADTPMTFGDLSAMVWDTARGGDAQGAIGLLKSVPENYPVRAAAELGEESRTLADRLNELENVRETKMTAARTKMQEHLAEGKTAKALSDALKSAVEIQLLVEDDRELLDDPQVRGLINDASVEARRAEAAGDWLTANELFYRLNLLEERSGTYKEDVERVTARLTMIRMYNPKRFWELRNDHQIKNGEDPLPPYNPLGEEFAAKLEGVDARIVLSAIGRAAERHVDNRFGVPHPIAQEMVAGGINALRTFVTTPDLYSVFPGMKDDQARSDFLKFLDEQEKRVDGSQIRQVRAFLDALMQANASTLRIQNEALLHEFGDGAMAQLDEFSAIIWPDQMRRFERMTQGQFQGVGIQIQMDTEQQMIKVVTPLEGTPAQRAGIQRDDLIKKINGQSAVGITLDQAVDLITGPENTNVTVTVQRGEEDIDFQLTRAVIPIHSVKGWKRVNADETSWDWFIDRDNGIGYVRLLQFTDETTRDLTRAVREMEREGLNGLILDLRFNPGGLLTEAVSVASVFVDQGRIVSTEGTMPGEELDASGRSLLGDIPVAVLINEGSASASEIVSGAIRHYADSGDIPAIIVGARSFGKGSVQNVWPLGRGNAMLKLTTQYYKLPDGTILHRKPGSDSWGVEPHVAVRMLPEQITEALTLRQEADVLPINEAGEIVQGDEPLPDPDRLITEGLDLQLQTALMLLRAQAVAEQVGPQAALNLNTAPLPGS